METCNKGGQIVKEDLYAKQMEVLLKAKEIGSVTPDMFQDLRDTFSKLEKKGLIVYIGQGWSLTPAGLESAETGQYETKEVVKPSKPGRKRELFADEILANQHNYNLRLYPDLDKRVRDYCSKNNVTISEFFRKASLKLIDDYINHDNCPIVEDIDRRRGSVTIQTPLRFTNKTAKVFIDFCGKRGFAKSVFYRVAADRALKSGSIELSFRNMMSGAPTEILSKIDDSLPPIDKTAEKIKQAIAKIELSADKGVFNRPAMKECADLKIKETYPALNARLERALEHAASVKNLMMIEKIVGNMEKDALNGVIDSAKTNKCRVRGIQTHEALFRRMESAMNLARANRNKVAKRTKKSK